MFAIAITLLVLGLKVRHLAPGHSRAIRGLSPRQHGGAVAGLPELHHQLFSILIIWVHHHAIFRLVCRTDASLLFANGLSPMMVTLIPFPTAVVAEYLRSPAVAFYLLAMAAFRQEMLDPKPSLNHAR